MTRADATVEEHSRQGRVCPRPDHWNRLWELLPDRRRVGLGWEPPVPLVLGGWHFSSDDEKRERFRLHLRWAEEKGAWEEVESLLSRMTPKDWHLES